MHIQIETYDAVSINFRKLSPVPKLVAYPILTPGMRCHIQRDELIDDALSISWRDGREVTIPGGNDQPRYAFTLTMESNVGGPGFGKQTAVVTGFTEDASVVSMGGLVDHDAKLYFDRVTTYRQLNTPHGPLVQTITDDHVVPPTHRIDERLYSLRPGDLINRTISEAVLGAHARVGSPALNLTGVPTTVRLVPVLTESSREWLDEILRAYDGVEKGFDLAQAPHDTLEQMSYATETRPLSHVMFLDRLSRDTQFASDGYVTFGELVRIFSGIPTTFGPEIIMKSFDETIEGSDQECRHILNRIYRATLSTMSELNLDTLNVVYNGATFIPHFTTLMDNIGVPYGDEIAQKVMERLMEEMRNAVCEFAEYITGVSVNCTRHGVMNVHLIDRGLMPTISIPMCMTGRLTSQLSDEDVQHNLGCWLTHLTTTDQVDSEED